jgi:hypothetical protein
MSPETIHQILTEKRAYLRAEGMPAEGRVTYSLGDENILGSTRLLRVKALTAGRAKVKRSVSARLGEPETDKVFSGSEQGLLDMVDDEIGKLRKHYSLATVKAKDGASRTPTVSRKRERLIPLIEGLVAPLQPGLRFTFERRDLCMDRCGRLLYIWEVFDGDGTRCGVYVGLATGGHSRPWTDYETKLNNLLARRPESYRRVHWGLETAYYAGHRIVVTLLCNVPKDEDIHFWEKVLILEMDSYGPGAHQFNDTSGESASGRPVPAALALAIERHALGQKVF